MMPTTLRAASRVLTRPSPAQAGIVGAIPRVGLRAGDAALVGRRFNMQESRGGKSKLIFRFGLKDVPVELYPIAFVVAAACVGAGFAVGRHLYMDGLRLMPTKKEDN